MERIIKKITENKLLTLRILAVLILVVGAVFVYKVTSKNNQENIQAFGSKREEAMSNFVYTIIGFSPETLKQTDSSLCERYSDYSDYLSRDTRQMSIKELQDALVLHDSCHYDILSKKFSFESDLSSSVSQMKGINFKIHNKKLLEITTEIFEDWKKIESLSSEELDIINNQIDRQKEYWQSELNSKLGYDVPSQREDNFLRLNNKTQTETDRLEEIKDERKKILNDEKDSWIIFKTMTGYIEKSDKNNK
jgi:hypothetical protein